ncbi:type II toxin-antitoxin system HipA family toxin YjjJ [Ramlibacter sp. H39-3-26]|uniref:type II toxin-antitoxin system HipA family toxin YjjJ n=1 Tax=Curvibacter soli TaxID=3031331 RepID=UPI0023DA5DAC|nr:type II toxin-antitoxin system HipA family toxin YjjJ [Ramlibacter sp. H39-3-26]MDF1484015.1 type II toxin-antitoxin system HipA family toxin YjjJ [Ramlibacter sp. H39-3-26]
MARNPSQSQSLLLSALARLAPASAAGLAQALGVSVPTLHRMLQALPPGQLVAAGRARRARYALRRPVHGVAAPLPVYAVDETGRAELLAPLAALHPQGCLLDLAGSGWPVPDESRDGWWPGLPYPLYDMRPQGYMGRLFARAEHQALGVSPDPQAWTDDDVLHVLSRRGWDGSGNLIVGDGAYALWQSARLALAPPLQPGETPSAYAGLAGQAVATGVPGSSAAGEFPKFAARRALPGGEDGEASATPHVLVKFSGADPSPTVRRWADLLVCEHLALQQARLLPGVDAARSRVLSHGGRTFLEVERFDRHGEHGRSPLCTLETVNAALVGDAARDWTQLARRLRDAGWLDDDAVAAIDRLWWFGRLIANTDMHCGNLSFRPQGGRLRLAPAYDMLPMLHAPLAGGEVPARSFEPPLPLPPQRPAWLEACVAALAFWDTAAADARIGATFRALCADHGAQLRRVATHA